VDINEAAFQAMLVEMREAGLVDGSEALARLVVLAALLTESAPYPANEYAIWQSYQKHLARLQAEIEAAGSFTDWLASLPDDEQERVLDVMIRRRSG
jgi:hypothetical protein